MESLSGNKEKKKKNKANWVIEGERERELLSYLMSSRHLRDIHRGPSDSPIYIDIAGNSVSLLRPSH